MKLIPESEADKTKDVFVGMWRPPWPEILKRYEHVTYGEYFAQGQRLREKYLTGEFDSCLYQRIEQDENEIQAEVLKDAIKKHIDKNFLALDQAQPEYIELREALLKSK